MVRRFFWQAHFPAVEFPVLLVCSSFSFCHVTVAATGLPDPRPDHALVMARFAKDCMKRMRELTKQLEATLGPDTGDLSMRIGMYHL